MSFAAWREAPFLSRAQEVGGVLDGWRRRRGARDRAQRGSGSNPRRRQDPSMASGPSLRCFPCFALDVLARVPDTLALVRLGLADLADVGGHLADGLLVDPLHDDASRLGHFEADP